LDRIRQGNVPITARVKAVVREVAQDPSFGRIFENRGAEARYMGSEEVERFIKE